METMVQIPGSEIARSRGGTRLASAVLALLVIGASACSDDDTGLPGEPTGDGEADGGDSSTVVGGIFAMTNRYDRSIQLRAEGQDPLPATEAANEVVAYARMSDGSLSLVGTFATGGIGANVRNSGANPLASQDPLIVTDDGGFLFAVNTGSDTVTSLRIRDDMALDVVDTVSTEGTTDATNPVSLTYRDGVLYVLSTGAFEDGAGNELAAVPAGDAPERRRVRSGILGFSVSDEGMLDRLAGAEVSMNTSLDTPRPVGANGGSVEFSADGSALYITERRTDSIVVLGLTTDGVPAVNGAGEPALTTLTSSTPQPFGTDIVVTAGGTEVLVVSQGNNGLAGQSTVSTYTVADDGALVPASQSAGTATDPFITGFTFGCWIETVVGADGVVYAYSANTPDGTLTGYRIDDADGSLERLETPGADGIIPATGDAGGAGVLDTEIADNFLYQVVSVGNPDDDGNNPRIAVFQVMPGGALARRSELDVVSPMFLPGQFVGIAGF